MYLIDTDVISALRRPERFPVVSIFVQSLAPDAIFVSVISLGEIEHGVELQRPKDKVFATHLSAWLEETRRSYSGNIIPVSEDIAIEWGRLRARLGHTNTDLLIAATAIVEGLTVLTRNVKHFAPTGVPILDPFEQPQLTPPSH